MKHWLAAALLGAAGPALADTPAWFPPPPCQDQAEGSLAAPGGIAIVRLHRRGQSPRDVTLKRTDDGGWIVPLAEWRRWTRRPPTQVLRERDGREWAALLATRDFAYRIDPCTAELWIEPNVRAVERQSLADAGIPVTPASPGGFINGEVHYGGFLGRGAATGLLDGGVFAAPGSARSGLLIGPQSVRRLDTTAIHDEPADALRLRLGDSIGRPPDWEPAVRYGGIQWGTDYSLQPRRITYPLPSFRGSAVEPSTVELYANGTRVSQTDVGTGNYQLVGIPTLSGAGELSVRVRDPLGRESIYSVPFYASPRLLAPGLIADSWEAGFLRENYAGLDDRYTRCFAALTLRRGFSDQLTGSFRGEATGRGGMLGLGADWRVGTFGIVSAALAGAADGGRGGGFASLGVEHVGRIVGVSLQRRYASSGYADLGRLPGDLHFSDSARISLNTGIGGSVSAVYASERRWIGDSLRFVGAAASQRLSGWSNLDASLLHTLGAGGGDSVQVSLTVLLAPRTSANLQWGQDRGQDFRRYAAQLAPPGPVGISAQAAFEDRANGLRMADGQWTSARGTVGAGLEGTGDHVEPAAFARTGVAFLGNGVYWTRPVDTSFAVVNAGGAGVRVYRDNLAVGRTDSDGRLLVPDLRPFDANRLRIDDRDLPIDRGVVDSEQAIAPPIGAGVIVHFDADRRALARLTLRDAKGKPVPAGSELSVDGHVLALPAGREGLVYAEISPSAKRLQARWDGHRCVAPLIHRGTSVVAGACVEPTP